MYLSIIRFICKLYPADSRVGKQSQGCYDTSFSIFPANYSTLRDSDEAQHTLSSYQSEEIQKRNPGRNQTHSPTKHANRTTKSRLLRYER